MLQEDNRGGAQVPGGGGDRGVRDCLCWARDQHMQGYRHQWEGIQPLLLQRQALVMLEIIVQIFK